VLRNFPTGNDVSSSLRLSTRRRLLPDELAHARIFTPVFNGESAIATICARRGRRIERHAQRSLIPPDDEHEQAVVFQEDRDGS
jgi:hypothetical protein